ncbi:hypothetical protein QYE76_053367 [Lolium multiflorum]|uniref:Arabidopsis retrotransposon Orf1 C-terminal domain-containing protein n=1 Tax=Lolium multiflorum TaxID=4521 RepID=A0AAD8SXB7_LOLMU|nr:hypothetical protein QYE76_053367 [Lolium multiflorum]
MFVAMDVVFFGSVGWIYTSLESLIVLKVGSLSGIPASANSKPDSKKWQSLIKAAKPNPKKIPAYLGYKPTPAPSFEARGLVTPSHRLVVVESMDRDEIQENFMEELIANGTLDDRDDDVIPDDGGDDVTATYLNDSGEGAEDIEEEDPNGSGEEQHRKRTPDDAEELLAKIGRNHDDWSTPEPTPTPIVKKRGMIKLNDEDMREAKKSLKEKGIKPEDVKNLPPIEDLYNDKDDTPDKEEIEKEPEKHAKNKKYTKEDFIAEKHGILDDFFTLVNKAGLATYVGDEREQYYMLTKIFVESFKFHNTQYEPTVAFKIYGNPVTMELEEFCRALDIAPVGTARRIDDNPRDLLELYRGITEDDCRTIQRGKIRNIQLPAIKYFAYYIATSILGRENTSNISSYHLAFLNAALTGQTSYHLGSLIARRLSSRGPIFGGTIALRILTHLRLPLDSNDVPLTPRRLDIAAMKSHHFVTTDSTIDNMVYRMLFADGDEKEIPLPQPGLFNIDRQSWSRTKEEVEEHMKIQDFHQQHDSEDAEPSYDCTVTYPDASSSTYLEPGRSSSYYGDTTSWGPWE